MLRFKHFNDPEAQFAVELASMCRELKTLPGPGGLLDQDYYHYHLLRAGMVALNEKREADQTAAMNRRH